MRARILSMPPQPLAVVSAPEAGTRFVETSLGGPYLIWRRGDAKMASSSRKAPAKSLVRDSRVYRPAHETSAQTRRIVAEVRAGIACNPEFSPFVDRSADDMRQKVSLPSPPRGAGRFLSSLRAGLRSMRHSASAALKQVS